uniref:Eukaryotic translation initiation factor 3 subunit H n=1 Tax=Ascaris lumbricoides TaxID=6252 RepID=A0A9J2PAG2_ASCLU
MHEQKQATSGSVADVEMSAGASNVQFVQIDSLVVMKIVKHIDSELYAGMNEVAGETCQGLLTGLVSIDEQRLEITNCFPTARAEPMIEGDENTPANYQYEEQKQAEMLDMLRKFRNMNIDYELVGFYQAHPFGACFAQEMVDSLVDYQASVQDGVVLIYDAVKTRQGQLSIRAYRLSPKALEMCLEGEWSPEGYAFSLFTVQACMWRNAVKTRQGQLSIRAYRLSPKALEMCLEGEWSPEGVRAAGLSFENMFDELPVVIKNSHLVNVMLAELALTANRASLASSAHLELGTRRSLEKCLRMLMLNIDDLNKTIIAYNKYVADKQRHDVTVYNAIQKRQAENEQREAKGEPPLSMDDIKKMKPPQLATKCGMLESFLCCSDAAAHADFAYEVTGENIAKLFLAEAIAEDRSSKDRQSSTSIAVTR